MSDTEGTATAGLEAQPQSSEAPVEAASAEMTPESVVTAPEPKREANSRRLIQTQGEEIKRLNNEIAELKASVAATNPFVESLMTDEERGTAGRNRQEALRAVAAEQQLRNDAIWFLRQQTEELIDAGALEPDIDLLASLKAGDYESAWERFRELKNDLDYTDFAVFSKSVKKTAQKARETKLLQPILTELDQLKAAIKERDQLIDALEANQRGVLHTGGGGTAGNGSKKGNAAMNEFLRTTVKANRGG